MTHSNPAHHRLPRTCMFLLVATATLGGCATNDQPGLQGLFAAPMALVDSLGLSPASAFRDAVRRKDVDAAMALYEKGSSELESGSPTAVAELVAQLNARWEPRLREQLKALEATTGAGPAQIESVSTRRDAAGALLGEYRRSPLLRPPGRAHPAAAELQAAIAATDLRLQAQLPMAFASWPHADKPLFFDAVGAELPPEVKQQAVRAGVDGLLAAVRQADAARAEALVKAYGPQLDASDRTRLARAYAERLGQQRFGTARPSAVSQQLAVARATAQVAGSPLPVFALSRPAAPPIRLDGEAVETRIAPGEVLSEARRAQAAGVALMLLIDPGMVAVVEELSDARQESERRQVGTRNVPNPQWREAQSEVQRLERELRDIEAQNAQMQSQAQDLARQSGGQGGGAFAALLGSYTGIASVVAAKEQLKAARELLDATPRQTSEAVYRDVKVTAWTHTSRTLARPAVYAVLTDSLRMVRVQREFEQASTRTVQGQALQELPAAGQPAAIELKLDELGPGLDAAPPMHVRELARQMSVDDAAFQRALRSRQQDSARVTEGARQQIASMQASQPARRAAPALSMASRERPAVAPGGCHATLAYLDQRIPRFQVAMLEQVRSEIVRADVRAAIEVAKSKGLSAESAVDGSNESARAMDGQAKVAAQCASEFDAAGESDDSFLAAIKDGRLNPRSCESMRDNCLCMAMALKLGALGERSMAAAMQCHAKRGQW